MSRVIRSLTQILLGLREIPKQIWVTLLLEGVLIFLTFFFLTEPGIMIRDRSPKMRKAFRSGGVIFLCVTFFWSFILGHLISIFHLTHHGSFGD